MKVKPIDILLVEDNPDHAELILKEFSVNGGLVNRIFLVKDGKEALDYLLREGNYADPEKSPRPGLILLDLKLPKVSGLEVLAGIKSDADLKMIPVVVITTSPEEEDIVKSYGNGVNSYIVKPVKFDNFVKVVREIKLYWTLTNKLPEQNNKF